MGSFHLFMILSIFDNKGYCNEEPDNVGKNDNLILSTLTKFAKKKNVRYFPPEGLPLLL